MTRRTIAILLAGAVVAAARPAPADQITRTDGTVLTGRIVSSDEAAVQLEIDRYGAKMVISIPRRDIASIVRRKEPAASAPAPATKPAATRPSGPTYYPLPILGTLGVETTAEVFEKALNDARSRRPDVVVLYFDTPGGTGAEMKALVDVLVRNRDLRVVGLVRRALSAGAVVALACKEIYMTPSGVIGDISPLTVGEDGRAAGADAKVRSALLAECRKAVQLGGHSELILRGMMEPELVLSVVRRGGRPTVVVGGDGAPLKAAGKLLTLTAKEAVACGLARGAAESVESLHAALGLDGWKRSRGGGWYMMVQRGKEGRRRAAVAEWKARREAYMERIAPDLKRIETELGEVRAEGRAAQAEKARLQEQEEEDRNVARSEYRAERAEAEAVQPHNPELAAVIRARARENYHRRLADIRRRYERLNARADDAIARLARRQEQLLAERKKLVDGAPEFEPKR